MARLLEYQGKDLLRRFGIAVPAGQVARSVDEARRAADKIGYPVVVKVQILAGKRGKAGGVRIVENQDELDQAVSELLSAVLDQSGYERMLRTEGSQERLDNLAALYFGDPELFCRLCDANRALRPEELTETPGLQLRITLPEGVPGNGNA